MSEIFLDVETQRLHHEVPGGWNNIEAFGLSLAITWDDACGFRTWFEPDASRLVSELAGFSRVVGYNILRFDYSVLAAYATGVHSLLEPKTIDMLVDLWRRLGFRPPLDSVAQATLAHGKTGDGIEAVRLFKAGELVKLASYCQEDVAITRDVFYYGRNHGHVLYLDRGRPARVAVKW
jgi:DEAD/DEAH box helicase domain-containing protein